MKYITPENLYDYAFLNEDTLKQPLRGICVCFHGYTDATMFDKSADEARHLGEAGIAWVFPYYSVWAWMDSNSQEFNEQVLDAVYQRLNAPEDIPLIISGGSMGGMTALNYVLRGKRRASACALNCPVTDMLEIFQEFRTMRRAILSAHIEKQGDLEEILKEFSPLYFADRLPEIPYYWLYGEEDHFFTDKQRPVMFKKLENHPAYHELVVVPKMEHCDLNAHPDAYRAYCDFMIRVVNGEKH